MCFNRIDIKDAHIPDMHLRDYNVPGNWRCWDEKPNKETMLSTPWLNSENSIGDIKTGVQQTAMPGSESLKLDFTSIEGLREVLLNIQEQRHHIERSIFTDDPLFRNTSGVIYKLKKTLMKLCDLEELNIRCFIEIIQIFKDHGLYEAFVEIYNRK